MSSIRDTLHRIERRLTDALPHADTLHLAPGRDELGPLGGDRVPDALRAELSALLAAADGQSDAARDLELDWLPCAYRLLSADEIAEAVGDAPDVAPREPVWEQDAGRVLSWLTHPARIPIAGEPHVPTEGGLYLDGVPGPAGRVGQVIGAVSECEYVVVAWSVRDLFETYAKLLDEGALMAERGSYGWRVVGAEGASALEVLRARLGDA